MFGEAEPVSPEQALALRDGFLDAVTGLDLTRHTDDEVLDLLRGIETRTRRLATVDHALITQIEDRRLAHGRGCASTAALLAAGTIAPAHARQITHTLHDLPTAVRDENFDDLERFLVEQAETFGPDQFAKITRHLSDVLDPDGTLGDSDYRHRAAI